MILQILTNQKMFNKVIVFMLLVYFMIMFTWAQVTGHQLNLENFITFSVPLITQIVHLIYDKTLDPSQKVEVVKSGNSNTIG